MGLVKIWPVMVAARLRCKSRRSGREGELSRLPQQRLNNVPRQRGNGRTVGVRIDDVSNAEPLKERNDKFDTRLDVVPPAPKGASSCAVLYRGRRRTRFRRFPDCAALLLRFPALAATRTDRRKNQRPDPAFPAQNRRRDLPRPRKSAPPTFYPPRRRAQSRR